jgi:hypothetical protein
MDHGLEIALVAIAASASLLSVLPLYRQYLRRRRLRGRIELPITLQIVECPSTLNRDIDLQLATRAACTIAKSVGVSPGCLRLSDILAGEYFENSPLLGLLTIDDEWDQFTTDSAELVERERGSALDESEAMRLPSWKTLTDVLEGVDFLVRAGSTGGPLK